MVPHACLQLLYHLLKNLWTAHAGSRTWLLEFLRSVFIKKCVDVLDFGIYNAVDCRLNAIYYYWSVQPE